MSCSIKAWSIFGVVLLLLLSLLQCSVGVGADAAPPPGEHSSSSGRLTSRNTAEESHDEAYNSIITNYYTTDPFFGQDMELGKTEEAPQTTQAIVSSPPIRLKPRLRVPPGLIEKAKIPAPLLARSERPPTTPSEPQKERI